MSQTYAPEELNIRPPSKGFEQGGWYSGRQYWNGTLSDPGVIHPASNQIGAGKAVSAEVNLQSDIAQGLKPGTIQNYLSQQTQQARPANYGNASAPVGSTQSLPPAYQAPVTPAVSYSPEKTLANVEADALATVQQPTIDLQAQYKGLYESSGISDLEKQYSQMEKDFIEAKGSTNNNPFLSEASRVGREAKLTELFNDRTANIRNEIATKKADVETQLNLALKQFDINSEQTKQSWDQFNALLNLGALDNASGDTIANITRSTGISSDLIYSAIDTRKKAEQATLRKEQREIDTLNKPSTSVVQSTNDAGVVTISVIDNDTGKVINQQSLGAIGNAQTGAKDSKVDKISELKSQMISALESVKNSYGHVSPQDWQGALASWIARGGDAEDFIRNFTQYADPNRGDFDQVYYQRN